ncbi:hypothetical protein BHE74_00049444 [Ensete ventricosum]|nr:hypothetical protein BHE74_00049444 [Ensete ventricosum]
MKYTCLTALSRFAFGHNKHLKSIAAEYWKPQANSLLSSLPSLASISNPSCYNPSQFIQVGSTISSNIGPVLRGSSDNTAGGRDGRISTSSPVTSTGVMLGSPLSDDSSHHSDSGILIKETASNGVIDYPRTRPLDNAQYSQFILAMCNMAKDPSPRVANVGRRALSIIGIELVVAKAARFGAVGIHQGDSSAPSHLSNLSGLARSSSWFDLNAGNS